MLRGFGRHLGNDLVVMWIGEAADDDLVEMVLSPGQRGCGGEGEKSSGGGKDQFIHCD